MPSATRHPPRRRGLALGTLALALAHETGGTPSGAAIPPSRGEISYG